MITVAFMDGIEHITCDEHLYQWDKGQSITIKGVVADGTPAIHFCNKKSERAIVVTPTNSSGVYTGAIPNSLLTEPYPIIAYLYAFDNITGKTIKTIEIPVESRIQPDDYIFKGDKGTTTLAEINSKVDAFLINAKSEIDNRFDELVTETGLSNADTLDGKHANEFANVEHTHSVSDITDFPTSLPANGGHAETANSATTAETSTNAERVCGYNVVISLDDPTTETCPEGTIYFQYE